ncbi:hypothetical protein F5B17DRAFT_122642 [Nemania serpens]|nr:hypothetical protein F5B17DRAFT_122642 [Nemania serpens]
MSCIKVPPSALARPFSLFSSSFIFLLNSFHSPPLFSLRIRFPCFRHLHVGRYFLAKKARANPIADNLLTLPAHAPILTPHFFLRSFFFWGHSGFFSLPPWQCTNMLALLPLLEKPAAHSRDLTNNLVRASSSQHSTRLKTHTSQRATGFIQHSDNPVLCGAVPIP